MPIPISEVGRTMVDGMVRDLTAQYGHPVDRALATKALFVTFGGVLAKTEEAHEIELRKMFDELERA